MVNESRQRIHAGFLIETVQTGPIPDLKPEEAEDGIHTAELVVRKVVDWLGEAPIQTEADEPYTLQRGLGRPCRT
jgi:hypothetical protein